MYFTPLVTAGNNEELDNLADIKRIYRVATAGGYLCDLDACVFIWSQVSADSSAIWLTLPNTDEQLLSDVVAKARELATDTEGFEL